MDPMQTPRSDDPARASMVKQSPNQGFQARPGPPGSPRFPVNNGSVGGPRLIGQPPPNLNRLDSRTSIGPPAGGPIQFAQPRQPFGPRPTSAPATPPGVGNFARTPSSFSVNPNQGPNQGPPRFPQSVNPGIRGPYPPPGQRLPFNQNNPQNIRPRPPGPQGLDIRQPRPIPESPGSVRNETLGHPVSSARNLDRSQMSQEKDKMDATEMMKNDDTPVKKKLASRNGDGDDDDDDDDDVVMDVEKQIPMSPKIESAEVQRAVPTAPAQNASPELKNSEANANSPTPKKSTTPVPEERPTSRMEALKTPGAEVEKTQEQTVADNESEKSGPQSVKSAKSPVPGDKTPTPNLQPDSQSLTTSPSPGSVLGYDNGKLRSLSPKSPVPQPPSPTPSPLVSSPPKSPGTLKANEKKKTTFAEDVEVCEDKNENGEKTSRSATPAKSPTRPGTTVIEKPQMRPTTPVVNSGTRPTTPVAKPGTRPSTPAAEKPGTRPTSPAVEKPETRPTTPAVEKPGTRPATPATPVHKPDPPTDLPKSAMRRSTSGRSIKSDATENGTHQANAQPTTNGVAVSPTKKLASKSREGDKSKPAGSPVKSPSKSIKSLPRTPEAGPPSFEKKKVPMNKVQVGAAPSPNLKTIRSKIGSLENTSYKPGGGKIKIENRKLDFSNAQSKIAAKNEKYTPSGGDKKITQVKLQWNAKPKVGSLDNATYKPGGGDKKIETVKLDFKDKAKPKVGSKDNAKHTPGGGTVKSSATPPKTPQDIPNNIETQKIDVKAESKVGSMDNVKHRPGGGDKKIFDDKDYLRQMSPNVQSVNGSGTQETDELKEIDEIQDPNPPPSTPTKSRPPSVISPVTPEAVKSSLQAKSPETPKMTITEPKVRASTTTLNKTLPDDAPTPRTKSPISSQTPDTPNSPVLSLKSPAASPKSPRLSPKSPIPSPISPRPSSISPRPPSSLDIKTSDKSSASSSRKSSPRGTLLPQITSPIQSEIPIEQTKHSFDNSPIKLPRLIETSSLAARAGLT